MAIKTIKKPVIVVKDRFYAVIDNTLVIYYQSLVSSNPAFKRSVLNAIFKYYFKHKKRFSEEPVKLKDSFTVENKGSISIRLNEENEDLFTFFCLANNRSAKQEAEYILVCFLRVLKKSKISSLALSSSGDLKFLINNKEIKL